MVFSIGDNPAAPLFLDNLRLERDTEADAAFRRTLGIRLGFRHQPGDGRIHAVGLGKRTVRAAATAGRTHVSGAPSTRCNPTRCTRISSASNQGGLAIDVPNGSYHVLVNIDCPSGFWGEYQLYRQRALCWRARSMSDDDGLGRLQQKYYRFWDIEDLPTDNTFDKYQMPYFQEKQFDVEVRDGQLNIEFRGENWACCVSAIVVYPVAKAAEGQRFLEFVEARRRFHFDNYFKRVLQPPGDPLGRRRRAGVAACSSSRATT